MKPLLIRISTLADVYNLRKALVTFGQPGRRTWSPDIALGAVGLLLKPLVHRVGLDGHGQYLIPPHQVAPFDAAIQRITQLEDDERAVARFHMLYSCHYVPQDRAVELVFLDGPT